MSKPLPPSTERRLSVMKVHVEPAQVWFDCPRCGISLEGFDSDPRGQSGIVCDACSEEFDIPASASLVIT
jgi:predicted RNA-binding Zn-ribbon protein involved in translation (DUF1610 family)